MDHQVPKASLQLHAQKKMGQMQDLGTKSNKSGTSCILNQPHI